MEWFAQFSHSIFTRSWGDPVIPFILQVEGWETHARHRSERTGSCIPLALKSLLSHCTVLPPGDALRGLLSTVSEILWDWPLESIYYLARTRSAASQALITSLSRPRRTDLMTQRAGTSADTSQGAHLRPSSRTALLPDSTEIPFIPCSFPTRLPLQILQIS